MEDGLVHVVPSKEKTHASVLILVVMEDGLVRMRVEGLTLDNRS